MVITFYFTCVNLTDHSLYNHPDKNFVMHTNKCAYIYMYSNLCCNLLAYGFFIEGMYVRVGMYMDIVYLFKYICVVYILVFNLQCVNNIDISS